MLRGLLVDRFVDTLARVTMVACFVAVWGAALGLSARRRLVGPHFLPA